MCMQFLRNTGLVSNRYDKYPKNHASDILIYKLISVSYANMLLIVV